MILLNFGGRIGKIADCEALAEVHVKPAGKEKSAKKTIESGEKKKGNRVKKINLINE